MAEIDREKVIKGMEQFRADLKSFCGNHADWERFDAGLSMLKEHEAVEPYSMNAERTYGICPKCGKFVLRYSNVEENHYCGICGQAVKWE